MKMGQALGVDAFRRGPARNALRASTARRAVFDIVIYRVTPL